MTCRAHLTHWWRIRADPWRLVFLSLCLICSTARSEENTILSIMATQDKSQVIVSIHFQETLTTMPNALALREPPRVVLDFGVMRNFSGTATQSIDMGAMRSARVVMAGNRAQVVFTLAEPMNYRSTIDDKKLILAFELENSELQAALPAFVEDRLLPFNVRINGSPNGYWLLLDRQDALYASADAFAAWRLTLAPTAQGILFRRQTWYALASVAGFQVQRDAATQTVDLNFAASAFPATQLVGAAATRLPVSAAIPALFLNYDLSTTSIRSRGSPSSADFGALTELGLSSDLGILSSTQVVRYAKSEIAGTYLRRLETSYTRDYPLDNLTLRLGDSQSRSSQSGASVSFGGVQLAKNFALTPGFVRQPMPMITGASSAASTMSLYINDVLRQTSNVPAGPFSIENSPELLRAGEARIVLRDVLGRETVIVQRLFTDPVLLEEGLSDWSAEAGKLRQSTSTGSLNYGDLFASGVWRHGLSKTVTAEVQGQLSRSVQDVGASASLGLPMDVLGLLTLAAGRSEPSPPGLLMALGVQRRLGAHDFFLRAQMATRTYRTLGMAPDSLPQRADLSTSYAFRSDNFGAIGVSLARSASYTAASSTALSASYSLPLFGRGTLALNATRVSGAQSGNAFGVQLWMPMESRGSLTSSVNKRSGQMDAKVAANSGSTGQIGADWSMQAGRAGQTSYAEGGWHYQGALGSVSSNVSLSSSQNALRLGAQGALVVADGQLTLGRQIDGSIAIIDVAGYGDVGVGFSGSTLTRTNSKGNAMLTGLQAYYGNVIRLDPSELPINAEIDNIEQVVVPARRRAVKVHFPVRSGRGALIKIVLENGEVAPAGAQLQIQGDSKFFFVARRGEAFVTGLQDHNVLQLISAAGNKMMGCRIEVHLPPDKLDSIARVGPLTCVRDKP